MTDIHHLQASEDFSKARGKALLSKIQNFMDADKDQLLSFNDVKEILKPKNETYKGMQIVSLDLIIGSEGRYRDFNKFFLPKADHLRHRWERVDYAHLSDVILPPIQLYEIGGVYFVRDGNHRVSVARSQGNHSIDAEVISLSSEIQIEPSMSTDQLRQAVVDFEKKLFFEKTNFPELTGDPNLDFTAPGRYDVIYNHILVHKYYVNQNASKEIPFSDALVSWYNNVYQPIITIINDERLYSRFPGRTPADLYVWIVKHWDFLKKKYGLNYPISAAARDFSTRYGKEPTGIFAWFEKILFRLRGGKS